MARRHPTPLTAIASALAMSCAAPDSTTPDPAAVQLAAAGEIVRVIATNPGPIALVCVGYAGDGERPELPSVDAPTPAILGPDGCVERDGWLVSRDGDTLAMSVSVRAPKFVGALRAEVSVFTSTGAVDLAVYTCAVRHRDGAWRSEGCELGATS